MFCDVSTAWGGFLCWGGTLSNIFAMFFNWSCSVILCWLDRAVVSKEFTWSIKARTTFNAPASTNTAADQASLVVMSSRSVSSCPNSWSETAELFKVESIDRVAITLEMILSGNTRPEVSLKVKFLAARVRMSTLLWQRLASNLFNLSSMFWYNKDCLCWLLGTKRLQALREDVLVGLLLNWEQIRDDWDDWSNRRRFWKDTGQLYVPRMFLNFKFKPPRWLDLWDLTPKSGAGSVTEGQLKLFVHYMFTTTLFAIWTTGYFFTSFLFLQCCTLFFLVLFSRPNIIIQQKWSIGVESIFQHRATFFNTTSTL